MGTLPATRFLFQEAQGLLERGLAVGGRVDDKAANLVTFNAVVLGLLATGLTVAHPASAGWTAAAAAGPALLLASMLCAVRAYRPTDYGAGIQAADLDRAVGGHFTEPELLGAALRVYRAAVELNQAHLRAKVFWVRCSIRLLAAGLITATLSIAFIIPFLAWRLP